MTCDDCGLEVPADQLRNRLCPACQRGHEQMTREYWDKHNAAQRAKRLADVDRLEFLRPSAIDVTQPTILIHAECSADTTTMLGVLGQDPLRLALYVDLLEHHLGHIKRYMESKKLAAQAHEIISKHDSSINAAARAQVAEARKTHREKKHESDVDKITAMLGL